MPKYQFNVTCSADGYVTVTAKDEATAKRLIRSSDIRMDYSSCPADTGMMPEVASLEIYGGAEVVEEDEEE